MLASVEAKDRTLAGKVRSAESIIVTGGVHSPGPSGERDWIESLNTLAAAVKFTKIGSVVPIWELVDGMASTRLKEHYEQIFKQPSIILGGSRAQNSTHALRTRRRVFWSPTAGSL